ncbi:M24 family metallopeptidase [Paenarthrobacter sp. NPDC058040]|uniref:M24 family metallopeptidase n=1 Tax=unclassified Paenarthrobacter TaxID=2634190 RepID=UPI0036DE9B3D
MAPHNQHFTTEEFQRRQSAATAALEESDLDGILLFKIEDMYWLCGLDTDGFCIFHAMFLNRDGRLTHISRVVDLANVRYSSICEDIRVWRDGEDNPVSQVIKDTLASHGMAGKRVGIQLDTMGLTPKLHQEVEAALGGWCQLVNASGLVQRLRLVKSPTELVYIRRAGEIVDSCRDLAIEGVRPGVFEGDLMGRLWANVFSEDGDPPAHRSPIGAGASALNGRYTTGRKKIVPNDQVTFELGAGYRHYHAVDMFVVLTGPDVDPRHVRMHEACRDALEAVQEKLRPGNTLGEVYEVHRAVFAKHGFEDSALAACGYTMGAVWPPTWMEQPMIYAHNPVVIEPNMTFFTHMMLVDQQAGLTMSLGEQVIITDGKPERITTVPREPIIVN